MHTNLNFVDVIPNGELTISKEGFVWNNVESSYLLTYILIYLPFNCQYVCQFTAK